MEKMRCKVYIMRKAFSIKRGLNSSSNYDMIRRAGYKQPQTEVFYDIFSNIISNNFQNGCYWSNRFWRDFVGNIFSEEKG